MEDSIANNVQLFVAIGSMVAVVLVAAIVLFFVVHQKKMYRSQLALEKQTAQHRLDMLHAMNDAQESEKTKIAATIHDQVGTIFFTAKSQAGIMSASGPDQATRDSALQIEKLIMLAYEELRKSIYSLSPVLLDKFGLLLAIKEFFSIIGKGSPVVFEYNSRGEELKLTKKEEVAVYRVMQEIVNNALKHSGCSAINANVIVSSDKFTMTISDNGSGFDLEAKKIDGGLGLKNIENRISLVGGNLKVESETGIGTTYTFSIPFSQTQKSYGKE